MHPIQLWRTGVVALAALLPHLAAGAATVFSDEPSPYNAARGDTLGYPDPIVFKVNGFSAPAGSWRVGGSLPPGVSVGPLSSPGDFNSNTWPVLNGTPTAAGTYVITLRASQGANQTGELTDTMSYEVRVSPDRYPPLFKSNPPSLTTNAGATTTIPGTAYFADTYQWRFNGVDIPGATSESVTFVASAATAGFYSVVASGPGGTATSAEASVTVVTTPPQGATLATGDPLSLSVSVANSGGSIYQWRRNGTAIAGATRSTYAVPAVTASDAGSYTVAVSNYADTAVSAAALVTVDGSSGGGTGSGGGDAGTPPPVATGSTSHLTNMSVRTNLPAGQTLIVGFVSDGPKTIAARAVGPTLSTAFPQFFTAAQVYADPRIAIFDGPTQVAANDNWDASLGADFTRLGAFPLNAGSRDAAVLQSIDGPRTMQISGSGSGVLLFEAYDTDVANPARLKNLSARNQVGTGDNILITGFVIQGSDSLTLLVRGLGPWLFDNFGISDRLVDPKLEIHDAAGNKIAENDNWSASLSTIFSQVGAAALTSGSKDAALVVTLPPGVYTAQLSGVNSTTGDAVVELFEVR